MTYPALGLVNEAGEVAGKVKKVIRDDGDMYTPASLDAIGDELGDVLWYIAAICRDLELDMDLIAAGNLNKLRSRADRGKLQGSGDDR